MGGGTCPQGQALSTHRLWGKGVRVGMTLAVDSCLKPAAPKRLSPRTLVLSLNPFPLQAAVPIGLSPPRTLDPPVLPILTSLHPHPPVYQSVVPTEPSDCPCFTARCWVNTEEGKHTRHLCLATAITRAHTSHLPCRSHNRLEGLQPRPQQNPRIRPSTATTQCRTHRRVCTIARRRIPHSHGPWSRAKRTDCLRKLTEQLEAFLRKGKGTAERAIQGTVKAKWSLKLH